MPNNFIMYLTFLVDFKDTITGEMKLSKAVSGSIQMYWQKFNDYSSKTKQKNEQKSVKLHIFIYFYCSYNKTNFWLFVTAVFCYVYN